MSDEQRLEGWTPPTGPGEMPLERVIDLAFDYRGNVTIVKNDGSETVGYVCNRNRDAAQPFLQYFDEQGDGPFTLRYAEVRTIKFTGKDMAAGQSYEAWQRRKEQEEAAKAAIVRGQAQ
jgi:hypothetical protein